MPTTPLTVSIHARAWRATKGYYVVSNITLFQFTPARGGRRCASGATTRSRGFNSRPRVAGDILTASRTRARRVSIHARAWRATPGPWRRDRRCGVSIHARAWRATSSRPPPVATITSFNSRPRVAGDRRKLLVSCLLKPCRRLATPIVYHFSL